MILRDYECPECGVTREELVDSLEEPVVCEKCGGLMLRVVAECPKLFKVIVPMYRNSQRLKAGFSHTSKADHNATRIQVGYGGGQRPKD